MATTVSETLLTACEAAVNFQSSAVVFKSKKNVSSFAVDVVPKPSTLGRRSPMPLYVLTEDVSRPSSFSIYKKQHTTVTKCLYDVLDCNMMIQAVKESKILTSVVCSV